MKEFKGTPGPWRLRNRLTSIDVDIPAEGPYDTITDIQDIHDARLIAASPDILSALQHLVEVYDSEDGKQWTTTSKKAAITEARAAIDKALGE